MKNSTSNFSIGTGWPICWSKSLIPLFLLLTACEKWDLDQANFPEVSTVGFDPAANPTEVILYGQISGLVENDFASNHGHIWSLTPDSLSVGATVGQSLFGQKGNGSFQSKAQELSPGNTYYYRSYLVYENQPPIYGAIKAFNTESLSPELSIDSISREGEFTIRILTAISGLPVGLPLTSFGITWSQDSLPDIEKDAIVPEQGIIVFEPEFKFESEAVLPTGQSYLRPYLLVGNEVYYGDSKPYKIGNIWNQTADFSGGPRFGAIGFSIGQKGYVGTGNDGGNHKKDFWEYDPLAGTWTQRADFGGGLRAGATGFSIGQKGYVGTGIDVGNINYRKDFWEYDPLADAWTQKADFGGTPRIDAVGFSIGQKGYVGTGNDDALRKDFWEYDPLADAWTQKAGFGGTPRKGAVGFSIGQKGYVGTGYDDVSFPYERKDFWEYDPQADAWTQRADFGGNPRVYAIGFSIGQKGYLGTGDDGNIIYRKDFWEYDPQTDAWTQKAGFDGEARKNAVGFSVGQRGYVGTGVGSNRKDFWEYAPE